MDRLALIRALCAPSYEGRDILNVEGVLNALPLGPPATVALLIAVALQQPDTIDATVGAIPREDVLDAFGQAPPPEREGFAMPKPVNLFDVTQPDPRWLIWAAALTSPALTDGEIGTLPTNPTAAQFDAASRRAGLPEVGEVAVTALATIDGLVE